MRIALDGDGLRAIARAPADQDDFELWIAALVPLIHAVGVPSDAAASEAVLWVATCRGLLWLLVTGHSPAVVDAAADRFFARYRS